MPDEEGGRWDVAAGKGAIHLVRVSESNEQLFEASLAPEEARELADLLHKYASKADESAADSDQDDEDESREDEDHGS